MLRVLLAKDLRRAFRNPIPWAINLVVPLCITALIGLVFGGKSDSGAMGRIRFGVVDEDKTALTDFLRGAANQNKAGEYLEPVFLDREEAMREIGEDRLSAVVIIPAHFMKNYLSGAEPVRLELIKNPARSIQPAVLEELSGALVTALNALARNFRSEFPAIQSVMEGKADYHEISALIDKEGAKLQTMKEYINPPLVSYAREEKAAAPSTGFTWNIFAYLLSGMTAMFLLFIASTAVSDLYREIRVHTFARYCTLRERLLPFVTGKLVFTFVLLLLCSAIMLGGGMVIFRIRWAHPIEVSGLTVSYCWFAAAFMTMMVAVVRDERRAAAFNNIAGMILGIAGGCAFPPEQLPAFLREHITPLLPSYWYTTAMRSLQSGATQVHWWPAVVELLVLGAVLIILAAALFRRHLRMGIKP